MIVAENWMAHRVQRYHTNLHLARFGQTTADHAHGVASIIMLLHPEPSMALLRAALWHDAGERFAGDLPTPFKMIFPSVAREHRAAEARLALRAAPVMPMLDETEEMWLSMADGLEACLYCALNKPDLLIREDWAGHLRAVIAKAEKLGVMEKVARSVELVAAEGGARG